MGLTQVMLQVKGCEMVCKQRELIPEAEAIVTSRRGPPGPAQRACSSPLPSSSSHPLSGLSNSP